MADGRMNTDGYYNNYGIVPPRVWLNNEVRISGLKGQRYRHFNSEFEIRMHLESSHISDTVVAYEAMAIDRLEYTEFDQVMREWELDCIYEWKAMKGELRDERRAVQQG